jgi:hypothetical protein
VDTVRIARDFGTVAELLPAGIDDARDIPHVLFRAIRNALVFLSFDELPDDERPPQRIWNDDDALKAWFDEVKRRRDEKYGGEKAGPGPIEDPVENAAAKSLLVD